MRCLVWFRSDLRVRDNRALTHACRDADQAVIGVYTICPKQWRDEHDWADIKVEFILRNLRGLSDELAEMGIPLLIRETPRFRGVPKLLADLAAEHDIDALHFADEYEVNERERDEAVVDRFEKDGRSVHRHTDTVMIAPGQVRTNDGAFYNVFTPFKRRWLDVARDHDDLKPLPKPSHRFDMPCDPDDVPASVKGFDAKTAKPDLWQAGEQHALDRLRAFMESRIADYDDRRDLPAVNGASTLSPYLAQGVISPRRCLAEAIKAGGGRIPQAKDKTGPAVWISELIWREFYKHLLVGCPRVSRHQPMQRKTRGITWKDDDDAFDAWRQGRTGYPIVDAAMRQLNETGWMHNRLRMIVAMFLTKDLFLDWRRGERYFMHHLIDGDLAANNGGWQWSASTGADAAPYFRIFNPTTQGQRYDKDGEFIRTWVPELSDVTGKTVHDPPEDVREQAGYPAPIVDHKEAREHALAAFKSL